MQEKLKKNISPGKQDFPPQSLKQHFFSPIQSASVEHSSGRPQSEPVLIIFGQTPSFLSFRILSFCLFVFLSSYVILGHWRTSRLINQERSSSMLYVDGRMDGIGWDGYHRSQVV